MTEIFLYLLLAAAFGLLAGWLLSRLVFQKDFLPIGEIEKNYVLRALLEGSQAEQVRLQSLLESREEKLHAALQDASAAEQNLLHLEERLREQKSDLEAVQQQMQLQFENLANRLLEEKSEKFVRQNREQIGEILTPLREKIDKFEKRVNEVYHQEATERSTLKGEIKSLLDLNQRISQEAQNLTHALKGDTKKQGNWGELILERVLERSGLRKGEEYELQYADTNGQGTKIQPDVVVYLPDQKHLIVDSKVSLLAYERFVNATEEAEQQQFLKAHVVSFRQHIRGLAEKNYSGARSLNSPDFVLMFVPVESSFAAAVQADSELFHFAWDLKIVIVSPSTLLATLRTIASIWKQEKQSRNAQEIARQAGALYDKFVVFLDDMRKIGTGIEQVEKTYQAAMSKLQSGQGNLIRRAERIRSLGVKTAKRVPDNLLEDTEESLAELEE
jgi:DNA recombination protein RmuC